MKQRATRFALAAAAAGFLGLAAPHATYAAARPGRVTALPNPPASPERDVFLVTFPHSHHPIPSRAVFTFEAQGKKPLTTTVSLKRMNRYQYETAWTPPSVGSLEFQAFTADNHLVAAAHYPVTKAKPNVIGRVVLGGIFIAGSVFLWYRQQRFYRR